MNSHSYNRNERDSVNIYNVFTPYLTDGEVIEWCGQPSLKPKRSTYNVMFGAFFSGFSLFWALMASQASVKFALFALPFFLAGLFIMFGQPTKNIRKNTYYAVTDRRCIIISYDKQMSFCDYRYSAMSGVNCINGSIMLAPPPVIEYHRRNRQAVNASDLTNSKESIKTNFIDINENAPKVCQLITMHLNENE